MATRTSQLPDGRLEQQLPDLKPPFNATGAIAEANRCLYCYDAPCIKACPTAIDIPEFIRKIGTGNIQGAAKTILTANALGHSCARVCPVEVLCQGACVYNHQDSPPIQIGRLQRYATDYIHQQGIQLFHKGPSTSCKVAVIGGGPAGLACAHELTLLGHHAVVLEARPVAGGLNTNGVAPYKMQASTSLEEIDYLLEVGIELRTGVAVGRDVSRDQLEQDFDAVFIGVGLGPDGFMRIPGEELPGVTGAVAMIERIKLDPEFSLAGVRRAVVVGGGNTAIDAVRELKRLGVQEVTLLYRRGEAEMSGYDHEWAHAMEEGVRAVWWSQPEQLLAGADGRVDRLRCVRMQPGEGSRGALVPVEDSQFYLPTDLVVLAVGQEKLSGFFHDIGLEVEKGRVKVNPTTYQTSNPRYFAGGDCVNGGKEVVNAAAEGKAAARGIDGYLKSIHGQLADRQHVAS